ncbi:MAG: hypothetical protein NC911_06070, partial [Candidatus Omnitrophica bacterium]|nr:hypothetical protein [Candidatus Omnitrophota bacterium]
MRDLFDRRSGKNLLVVWGTLLFLSRLPLNASQENLLKNPGFEISGADGIPAFWEREYNQLLSGPFFLSPQAYEGRHAVCLMTEDWTLDRPQFLTQIVKLPQSSKAVRLSAQAKGQGLFRLSLQFLRGKEFLKVHTVNEYFGQYQVPEETDKVYGLGPEYTEYILEAVVPEGADGVRVRLGNTIGALNLANVWGSVWIDKVSLTIPGKLEPKNHSPVEIDLPFLQKRKAIIKKAGVPPGFRDIAPYCLIVTDPPSFNTGGLVDGEEGLPGPQFTWRFELLGGTERYPVVTFFFPERIPVSSVYLHLLGNLERFLVRIDTSGRGEFQEILADVRGLTGINQWLKLDWEEKEVAGIRLQAIEGQLRSYRATCPFFDEVKILAREEKVKPFLNTLVNKAVFARRDSPRPVIPTLVLTGSSAPKPGQKKGQRFRKMLTVDLWMFGINLKKDT